MMSMFLKPFIERASAYPDMIQFILSLDGSEQEISNAMIVAGARRYAAAYDREDLPPRSVVLISLLPGDDLIYAFVGAILAGHVPSLMPFPSQKQDPEHFWNSHNQLFKHIGGGILVTFEANVAPVKDNIDLDSLRILTPDQARTLTPFTPAEWQEDEVCCLQHSSGTTGLKKGVTLTSRAIVQQIESYQSALKLGQDDTIISWLPLYHDMGFVATFLLPLVAGNRSVIMSPFEWLAKPLKLFDLIHCYDGRMTWLPNFAFNHLAAAADGAEAIDLSAMRAFINCSEPCKASTFDRFLDAFVSWGVVPAQLHTCYAMAEVIFAVTQSPIDQPVKRMHLSSSGLRDGHVSVDGTDMETVLSTGVAIDGITLKIDGDRDIGEILISGEFVFKGYYRKDSENSFEDGFYKSGDIGFIDGGHLYVLGREKDLLIILGKNFYAHELEQIVSSVPGVKPGRVAALGLYNDEIGSEEAIIIAERDGTQPDIAMRRKIKGELSDLLGLVPRKILIVDQGWLVKSTSGKMSRSENMKKYIATLE